MINYQRLVEAQNFYKEYGFVPLEVPWEVDADVEAITKPTGLKSYPLNDGVLVASGEQGFLQLMKEKKLEPGSYQTITPCFRDEVYKDVYHLPYFMKLELILAHNDSYIDLTHVVEVAWRFFTKHIRCKIVNMGNQSFDIVSFEKGIELGSYGIRNHPLVGSWIYGTGLAEPRLTCTIENMG